MKKSVACIAFENGKILIAHRNPSGQMGNRWEFPGGKIDSGESDQEAVVREMQEEFGIQVSVLDKITSGTFKHCDKEFMLEVYFIKVPHDGIKNKYKLTEHTEYKWVDINDIPEDNFVESDLSVYPKIKEYIESMNM